MRILVTFALIVLGLAGDALAQSCASTQGQLEYCKALTPAVRFGFPRYTTGLLPPCNANNKGAVAFNTTDTEYQGCDGSSWAAIGGGGGTPGGADTQVQFNDGGAFGGDAGLTYNKTTNALGVGDNAAGGNATINATLGSEVMPSLATSANYTSGAGWAAGDPAGVKNSDGTGTLTPASGATVTAGTTYRITITLSAWSVGSATFTVGGNPAITTATSATTFEYQVIASATTKLVLTPTNTSRFTISSISVKPVTTTTGGVTAQGTNYFGPTYFNLGSSSTVLGLADRNEPTLGWYRGTAGVWTFTGTLGMNGLINTAYIRLGNNYGLQWGNGTTLTDTNVNGVLRASNSAASALLRWQFTAAADTVAGSCGTSPSVTGVDSAMKITTGTGSPTSCQVTFKTTWTTAPVCVANASTTTTPLNVATTTTTATISAAALTAGEVLHVVCTGF